MKQFLVLALVFVFSLTAAAHPGKTDRRGGHKCWKDCSEWGLEQGEYHLHDKDFRPIRLSQKGNVIEEPQKETRESLAPPSSMSREKDIEVKEPVEKHSDRPIAAYGSQETVPQEKEFLFNPLLLGLLALLLVLLLIVRRKKKEG